MTTKELMNYIEGYYGVYERPLMKQMVWKYLDQYSDDQRAVLWTEIKMQFSTRWNSQPDIAVFEEVVKKSEIGLKRVEGEVYNDGLRIGHYDGDRFIPDLFPLSQEKKQVYIEDHYSYTTPESYIALMKAKELPKIEAPKNPIKEKE